VPAAQRLVRKQITSSSVAGQKYKHALCNYTKYNLVFDLARSALKCYEQMFQKVACMPCYLTDTSNNKCRHLVLKCS